MTKAWMSAVAVCVALMLTGVASAAKTYQVTGPVLEVTEKNIVVQKDSEKWEIARDAATKVTGDLKVGAKVTIHYEMIAKNIEVKGEKAAEPAAAAKEAKPTAAAPKKK